MSKAIAEFGPKVRELAAGIEKFVPAEVTDNIEFRVKRYTDQGVPVALAKRIAYTILLVSAPDIIRSDAASKRSLSEIARLYFRIGETFGLGWLRYNAEKLPADTHWQKLAAAAVIEELYAHQKNLTLRMMNGSGDPLESWSRKNTAAVDQMKQMLAELKTADPVDLSMLAVASRHLSALSNGG
jgi:glutamate dehydrogenase